MRALAALRARLAFSWRRNLRNSGSGGATLGISKPKVDFVVAVQQPAAVESNNALMVTRILWYSRLSRFFGCLFISNLSGKTLKKATATWKSPYTVYAAFWFSMFLGYQTIALVSTSKSVDKDKTFPRYLRFVSYAISVAKVCVNYMCFCLGSKGLLEFLRNATLFERSTSFSPRVKRRLNFARRAFNVTVRTVLVASFIGAFGIAVTEGMRKLPSAPLHWRLGIGAVVLGSEVAFFMYESLVHVIMTRCSEVLQRYLESELARLEANCTTDTHYAQLSSVSKIAMVRVNVCKIKALKRRLDKICGPAIVASSASLLALLCLNVYRSFTVDVHELELWLPIVYTVYCCLCLVDMAFVSDDLAKQTRKVKDAAKTVTMLYSPKEYFQQVRYLHNTIEPEEMCFTGSNFFRLDRGLLLTVTGSVITFAVILMQTGGDLKRRMGLQ
ncbi:gustatory receptor for sugar taste 64e-like [Dermacentor albipictus]|uniref:gustatory receptor for sugar taste 64e-like n=1 Tax=Dermacentor albipictus TaxID=60249 RepID=UPI0038FCB21A